MNKYEELRIRNEEIRLFQTANIVADIYRANQEDIILINTMVKSYGRQADARILILNSQKKVVVDSFNSYVNKVVDNEEIRNSLEGKSKSATYMLGGKKVLQLSVPISFDMEEGKGIEGVVLISASLDKMISDVRSLKNTLISVSAISLSVSLFLTIMAANRLTRPIRSLSNAVERLSSGNLGYQMNKQGSGEIGKLIESFNEMSGKLKMIENNRKHFISSISHELKTPLTAIRILIDSLSLGENRMETYKEFLEDIREETIRMSQLVDYLLKSIKLEDVSLDMKVEDMAEILEDVVKLIKPYAQKNDVLIYMERIDRLSIKCDKNKVKEALMNLFDNAVKYKDPYKEENNLVISMKKFTTEGVLTIEDNGIGIKEDDLYSIFDRGFRVLDSSINMISEVNGYGIGLSIVKNIIEKHGWKISVESTYGKGTKFIINIPL
ncbi:sensor histidine kinase [Lutispora thermophila]|uniref:sensor histidine kinase n=1 Tax=Lutispora thermophila TaxID=288966 RepID=UPI0015874FB4|nr:HAMP domain-containing sensor histidine kinase [Lutispora thermophila]